MTADGYDMMFGLGAVSPLRSAPRRRRLRAAIPLRRRTFPRRRGVVGVVDREIAKACRVGESFVRSLRPERGDTRTYTNRHGSVSTMNTSNIARRPASEPRTPLKSRTGGR